MLGEAESEKPKDTLSSAAGSRRIATLVATSLFGRQPGGGDGREIGAPGDASDSRMARARSLIYQFPNYVLPPDGRRC